MLSEELVKNTFLQSEERVLELLQTIAADRINRSKKRKVKKTQVYEQKHQKFCRENRRRLVDTETILFEEELVTGRVPSSWIHKPEWLKGKSRRFREAPTIERPVLLQVGERGGVGTGVVEQEAELPAFIFARLQQCGAISPPSLSRREKRKQITLKFSR